MSVSVAECYNVSFSCVPKRFFVLGTNSLKVLGHVDMKVGSFHIHLFEFYLLQFLYKLAF